MSDWAAWGDDEMDRFRDDYHETRRQVICDDCGKVQLRGLIFRNDLETPVRLCRSCCEEHDSHPQVIEERNHREAMDSDHDDF